MAFRKSFGVATALSALVFSSACSGVDTADHGEQVASTSSALRCISDPNNPDCPWRGDWTQLKPRTSPDITHAKSPVLCAGSDGFVAVSSDTSNHFRILQFSPAGAGPSWDVYGPNTTFSSKPVCAMRENDGARNGMVIVGKATNNLIYASAATLQAAGPSQVNPKPVNAFATITGDSYPSGSPALVSGSNIYNPGSVLMTVMGGNSGNTIYGNTRRLPYLSNSWLARVTGPTLPSGWVPIGAPAMAMLPVTVEILVHARKAGVDAIFKTFYFDNGSQSYFSDEIGSPSPAWTQLPSIGAFDDDMTLTNHPSFGLTLYIHHNSAGQILEAGDPFAQSSFLAVRPGDGFSFASAAGAVGDNPYDAGTTVVIARRNDRNDANHIWWIEAAPDLKLEP
jgi:hypothetical protein